MVIHPYSNSFSVPYVSTFLILNLLLEIFLRCCNSSINCEIVSKVTAVVSLLFMMTCTVTDYGYTEIESIMIQPCTFATNGSRASRSIQNLSFSIYLIQWFKRAIRYVFSVPSLVMILYRIFYFINFRIQVRPSLGDKIKVSISLV